jgi:hypothetical protein
LYIYILGPANVCQRASKTVRPALAETIDAWRANDFRATEGRECFPRHASLTWQGLWASRAVWIPSVKTPDYALETASAHLLPSSGKWFCVKGDGWRITLCETARRQTKKKNKRKMWRKVNRFSGSLGSQPVP